MQYSRSVNKIEQYRLIQSRTFVPICGFDHDTSSNLRLKQSFQTPHFAHNRIPPAGVVLWASGANIDRVLAALSLQPPAPSLLILRAEHYCLVHGERHPFRIQGHFYDHFILFYFFVMRMTIVVHDHPRFHKCPVFQREIYCLVYET